MLRKFFRKESIKKFRVCFFLVLINKIKTQMFLFLQSFWISLRFNFPWSKVHILWDSHEILWNLHRRFVPVKSTVGILQNFGPSQNIWTLSKYGSALLCCCQSTIEPYDFWRSILSYWNNRVLKNGIQIKTWALCRQRRFLANVVKHSWWFFWL